MPQPTRRDLLAGATAGAVAAFHSEAHAGIFEYPLHTKMLEHAEALRRRWNTGAEDMRATLLLEREGEHPLRAESDVLRRGFAGLEVFKELELLSVEEQVQTPIQALLTEIATAVGRAVQVSSSLFRAYIDGTGAQEDPDENHLRGAIGALRIGIRSAKTTYGRQQMLENTLTAFTHDHAPGILRTRMRRLLRRSEKAEALAQRIADDPSTGILEITDPATREQVQAALATTVPLSATAADETPDRGLLILGIIGLGVVAFAGTWLAVGGLCATACGDAVGVIVLLLGVALIGLAMWGIIALAKRLRGSREASAALDSDPPMRVQVGLENMGWVDLEARKGWVSTGLSVHAGQPMLARAWGVVRGGRLWAADAEGDGVVAGLGAPLPGAPARALIGRVGEHVFFLGVEQLVPEDLVGELEIGINAAPSLLETLRGGFTVQVLRPTPA